MKESAQSGLERAIRKVLWSIIAIFVLLGVVPFVGRTLYDAFAHRRGPFPWRDALALCAFVSGPFLLWISLAAMYFRAPRELRNIYFGQLGGRYSGRTDFAGIYQFFSGYRKRFGIDVWFWVVLMSIPWTIIVIVVGTVFFPDVSR